MEKWSGLESIVSGENAAWIGILTLTLDLLWITA